MNNLHAVRAPSSELRKRSLTSTLALLVVLIGSACTGIVDGNGKSAGSKCTGAKCDGTGTGASTGDDSVIDTDPGSQDPDVPSGVEGIGWTTRFPRLTHTQWENTVRDLFRLDRVAELSKAFTPDAATRFETSFAERKVSANLWTDYQTAAETLAKQIASDPAKLAKILPANLPAENSAKARAFVTEFGKRAYRRPLSDDEINKHVTLFEKGAALLGDDAWTSGVELLLRAILQSPHFIYRVESSIDAQDKKIWLKGYEIATRLSYTLWNSMPSDELLAAAEGPDLTTAQGVEKWARKLLDDARAQVTLVSFHEQLFRTAGYGTIQKDNKRFPGFTTDLAPVLQQEANLFLDEVTNKQGGDISEILTKPLTFVNDKTAKYYGLGGTFGPNMQKVDLDASQRAGLLTQIGFLSKNGGLVQSDPIHRGVIINLNLLCNKMEPPPNAVPPLPAQNANQTNRELIEGHTTDCGRGCHDSLINPVGFAFEHYDAIGQWRSTDNDKPINSAAEYELDGKVVTFQDAVELSKLLARSPRLHECYAANWIEYSMGRRPVAEEAQPVSALGKASVSGTSAKDLLATVTALDLFRARPEESQTP